MDAGHDSLLLMRDLRELSLDQTPVSNEGLIKRRSLSRLQEVSVQNSRTTREGVAALNKSLPKVIVKLGHETGVYRP
jgi:hypothetical protein